MQQRIIQLEDALASLQSRFSTETHPLLRDQLKCNSSEELNTEPTELSSVDQVSRAMDALGTLTISNSGEVKYFGSSAGSEVCLTAMSAFTLVHIKSLEFQTLLLVRFAVIAPTSRSDLFSIGKGRT